MLQRIRTLSRRANGLDLGCGKFRYTVPLAKQISRVTAVDSPEQVDREQRLFGRKSSLKVHASRNLPNVIVRTLDQRDWQRKKYEVILCSNVLSAIPCRTTRRQLVKAAYRCLSPRGQFILTTQYRNSHFDAWKSDPKAERYLDGFLVKGFRGATFYGLICSGTLRRLCESVGFTIIDAGHAKELAFVIATR
jgi:2-polyprenyl-3-methyl-5-hydroxy-6-metoxy-1,4-benzoquinol methylase